MVKKSIALLLLLTALLPLAALAADAASPAAARRLKSQVLPILPDMARQMNLQGAVRLEVDIAADGSVTSVRALGGHPILIQSAEQAVRKWRFQPGPASRTVVEFNFHPDARTAR